MKANSSSLPDAVEIGDDAIVVLLLERFVETVTSMPIAAEAVPANSISKANPNNCQGALETTPLHAIGEIFMMLFRR